MRVAYVDDDEAQFTAEGDEIPEGEPTLAEVLVHTAKVAAGSAVQRAVPANQCGNPTSTVGFTRFHPAGEPRVCCRGSAHPARCRASGRNRQRRQRGRGRRCQRITGCAGRSRRCVAGQPGDAVAYPGRSVGLGWAELRKFKVGSAYNQSLLDAGTTDAKPMLSLPVIVDPAVPDYSGVVVDQRAVVSAVGQVKVATSEHQYFSSDSVLLKATWRFGHCTAPQQDWAVHHPRWRRFLSDGVRRR
jgi:hypothetical protein